MEGKEIGCDILEIPDEDVMEITETPKAKNLTVRYKGAKGEDKKEDFGGFI